MKRIAHVVIMLVLVVAVLAVGPCEMMGVWLRGHLSAVVGEGRRLEVLRHRDGVPHVNASGSVWWVRPTNVMMLYRHLIQVPESILTVSEAIRCVHVIPNGKRGRAAAHGVWRERNP
jgi:hypothetical protein